MDDLVTAGETSVPKHFAEEKQTSAGYGHSHPLLPAADRHQRHHVLRPCPVQHHRVRSRRISVFRRHHRCSERGGYIRVDCHGRSSWPACSVPGRWCPDVRISGTMLSEFHAHHNTMSIISHYSIYQGVNSVSKFHRTSMNAMNSHY
jgi:hypothetical protein